MVAKRGKNGTRVPSARKPRPLVVRVSFGGLAAEKIRELLAGGLDGATLPLVVEGLALAEIRRRLRPRVEGTYAVDARGNVSGPYCQHWGEPWSCDEECFRCGHTCAKHFGGETCSECGDCPEFVNLVPR